MDLEHQVMKAWCNVRSMLRDRGEDTEKAPSVAEVAEIAGQRSTFTVAVTERTCVVFHTGHQTVKKAEVFSDIGDAEHIIVVINTRGSSTTSASSKPNNATVKSLGLEAKARDVGIEIWTLKETQYNVTEHSLVPKHEKLSPEEAADILTRLCVKNRFLLPAIASSDPVARYLHLQPGDIVRIHRPSPTSGKTIAYRCCRKA